MNITCRNCGIAFYIEKAGDVYQIDGDGLEIVSAQCPSCRSVVVVSRQGKYRVGDGEGEIDSVGVQETIIFPLLESGTLAQQIPDAYRKEFAEAKAVLPISPKASAALSRRLLQMVLREKYGIKKRSLQQEIDEFCKQDTVPSFLVKYLDYVRQVGNIAAHPALSQHSTGEQAGLIIDVEYDEAEWLINLLDALFEYAFVRPSRDQEMKEKLDRKIRRG